MQIFVSLLVSLSFLVGSLSAVNVSLRADVWCPYNCDPHSANPGFMVEVAQFAFKKHGDNIQYALMDWTRAVEDAEAGKFDGLIATTPVITPDFIFPEQELALAVQSFWTKKAFNWVYKDLSSLEGVILVVMDKYSYGEPIDSYIAKNKHNAGKIKVVTGNDGRAEAANYVLLADKAVFIEENHVMEDFLIRSRLLEYFNQGSTKMPPSKMYIAFTPKNASAQQYADLLDEGVLELKKSGEWQRLLDKYKIKAW